MIGFLSDEGVDPYLTVEIDGVLAIDCSLALKHTFKAKMKKQ